MIAMYVVSQPCLASLLLGSFQALHAPSLAIEFNAAIYA